MKTILLILLVPACLILLSGTTTQDPAPETPRPLELTHAVVERTEVKLPSMEGPVLLRIQHQGFPFDVDGRFPFVVMIDNEVYRCDPDKVREFLSTAIYVNATDKTK